MFTEVYICNTEGIAFHGKALRTKKYLPCDEATWHMHACLTSHMHLLAAAAECRHV